MINIRTSEFLKIGKYVISQKIFLQVSIEIFDQITAFKDTFSLVSSKCEY